MPVSGAAPPGPASFDECRAAVDRLLSKQLFFVGGSQKSGTTWVQMMLDAHPDISCRGEGHFTNHFAPLLGNALKRHSAWLAIKNNTIFHEMAPFPEFTMAHHKYLFVSAFALLLDRACAGTVRAVGEKTPENANYFWQLAALFPQAKFVHVVRDARDRAVSTWFHNLRVNPGETQRQFATFASFLDVSAKYWAAAVGVAAAFADAHPGRCHELRYEDLAAKPLQTLGPLICFLGVDASPQLVGACTAEAAFEKVSGGRRRGEEDRTSFFRRGMPGDWRNHFSDDDNRAFLAICGPAMARYGYV